MKILHLSFDISDGFNNNKTVAIKNLIQVSDEIGNENFYFSLNRSSDFRKNTEIYKYTNHIEIKKFGFPLGVKLINFLDNMYSEILKLKANINKYDIIHTHKLTYEGYIAYKINKNLGINYCVSIRFTDFKVLKVRKDLKKLYMDILDRSIKIYCIAPWMIKELMNTFGEEFINKIINKIEVLPNIVECENYKFQYNNNNKYIIILKLSKKNIKRKNIKRTLKAIKKLNKDIKVDIVGDGNGKYILEKYINNNNLNRNIRLLGQINNNTLLSKISEYKALILCSYPETFGLVYIEALMNGIPIIYTQNAGIDGFFNESEVGESVDWKSVNSIKNAILDIENNFKIYKENIKKIQENGSLDRFRKENIKNIYSKLKWR